MSVTRALRLTSASLVAAALSACAGGGGGVEPLSLPPPTAPAVGSIPQPTAEGSQAIAIAAPVGSATELYSRVARGAMKCWFAAGGPLKQEYIYHATADAPSRGGKAEIVIHQRDPTQPNPRGAKAYRVNIEPTGEETAAIKVENLKMSPPYAAAMTDDVGRWAKGDQGCDGASTAAAWAPAPPPVADNTVKPATKVKKAKHKPAPPSPTDKP
jgi:hypothetical protein